MSTPRKILVTGASGQLGSSVLRLLADSPDTVIAGTRKPEQRPGARLVDFDRPETLDAAFAGIDRVLLISTDALDGAGTRKRQQLAAVAAAGRAGVKHIVYTSMPNPAGSLVTGIAPDHEATEQAIVASGIEHTILRNNLYLEVMLGAFAQAVATGTLRAAAGEGKVGFVTREDCARAAAAALTSTRSGSRTIDVAGPRSVGYREAAATLAEVTGKSVVYAPSTPEQQRQGLVSAGLPETMAELFVEFDTATAAGQLETGGAAVEELTGRAATSLDQFLAGHRADLSVGHT